MAGRGRGMTLPAWMTAGGAPPTNQAPPNGANPLSPPGQNANAPQGQFQRPIGAPPTGFSGPGGFSGGGAFPGAPQGMPQGTPPGQNFQAGRPPMAPGTYPPGAQQFGQAPGGAPGPGGFAPPFANQAVRPGGPPTGPPGSAQYGLPPGYRPPGSGPPGAPGQPGFPQGPPGTNPPGTQPGPGFPQGPPGTLPPGAGFPQAPRPFAGAPPGAFQPPAGPGAAPGPAATSSDSVWTEHKAPTGRTYFFNKLTKQSVWEKPVELLTPAEKNDPLHIWKEHTNTDGRKYFYNRITQKSTWTLPEELKAAREAQALAGGQPAAAIAAGPGAPSPGFRPPFAPSPSPMVPFASPATPLSSVSSPAAMLTTPEQANGQPSAEDYEVAKKAQPVVGKINSTPAEEAKLAQKSEPLVFANKQDAKNAFKEMLDSHKIGTDWTWEQSMKKIINDKRYGALKTLGEKKQAFNEYQTQKKKAEKEEQRLRQKKAREDFLTMLQQSTLLTATTRWSKAVPMFENDPRFKALEDDREREDLFEDYLVDLDKKEKEEKKREKKKNMDAFRKYLESCEYIKSSTPWRKVADKIEEAEAASKLERVDKMDVFSEYIRDLEKAEEEARQLEREKKRRQERKNRDAFRDLMNEHKAAGELTAKTKWADYCKKVKEAPAYAAVVGNASGSTPKELFEDMLEELSNQLKEEKGRVKDAIKDGKVDLKLTSSTEFGDFQAAVAQAGDLAAISEQSLKLIFKDLLERAKEKEEKESKKRKRLEEDFVEALRSTRAVYVDSTWAELKPLVEKDPAYKAIEEADRVRLFEEYLARQQAKLEEKEKRQKDKEKEDKPKRDHDKDKKREKNREHRGREKEEEDYRMEDAEVPPEKERDSEERRKERKHRKRHRSGSPEDGEGGERKHRHKEKKSSKKHGHEGESEGEERVKRHRSKHGERSEGGEKHREDGEVDSEDGEIR